MLKLAAQSKMCETDEQVRQMYLAMINKRSERSHKNTNNHHPHRHQPPKPLPEPATAIMP